MPPLSGIRIIDLSQFEAGTSCTESLAWLGAEVIKIEPPGRGEQGRSSSRDVPDLDSYYFILLNANKQSVTLNLRTERGREIMRDLIKNADVFVENFAPGAIERLGFGYDAVREINSSIVYASIKGFDPDGPYGQYLAMDPVAQAMGGSVAITGFEDDVPVRPGPTMADTGSGLHLSIGILAALFERQTTGRGRRVFVSMQEAVINFNRIAFARSLMQGGLAAQRTGNAVAMKTAPSNIFPCKPGGPNDYVYVYVSRTPTSSHWRRLLETIGREDLLGDPRFATPETRGEHVAAVDEIITAWTSQYTKEEATRILAGAGVPVGAIMDTAELAADPHLRSNGTFVTVKHAARGDITMPGWPVKFSDWEPAVEPAPLLGEHTHDVLAGLGVPEQDFPELHSDGVI